MTVQQVLVATDFSPSSDRALEVAREYARGWGARLHVLHVVPLVQDPVPQPRLDELARAAGQGLPIQTAVVSGVPAAEIVRYAARHAIDLIVVGTHGRTGVSRTLLGSVAERVVRTSPCPVLTVPREPRAVAPAPPAVAEPAVSRCLVCRNSSEDLICESCRARIRGEALERKQKEERAGRR